MKIRKMLLLLGISLSLLGAGNVLAKEEQVSSDGFTIEGVPNPDQIKSKGDSKSDSFYLYEKPGEKGVIKVKLINSSSKTKKLEVSIVDANTNKNGITDYTGDLKNYRTLKVPFTSLVEWKKKIYDLNPREVRTIEIPFQMPKKEFPGIIAGGIKVYEAKSDVTSKSKEHLSMGSVYGYTLGVVVTNTNRDQIVKNISVELGKVTPQLDYGHKVVEAEIVNPNPYVFQTEKVSGNIKSLDTNKKVLENSKKNVRIAPYQMFPMQFDFKKQDMKPGSYLLSVDVKAKEKTWHFERKFEITEKKAKKINEASPFKVFLPKWLNNTLFVLLIVTTIGTIYLFFRKKAWNKDEKKEV